MKTRDKWFLAALTTLPLLTVTPFALACGAFCPRNGSTGSLSLGLFTAVGLIAAAWIFTRKTDERR